MNDPRMADPEIAAAERKIRDLMIEKTHLEEELQLWKDRWSIISAEADRSRTLLAELPRLIEQAVRKAIEPESHSGERGAEQ